MKLHFQFVPKANQADRDQVFRLLRQGGAGDVHPLFQDESDPELAAVHVVESDDRVGQALLKRLQSLSAVEFAEVALERKLIR